VPLECLFQSFEFSKDLCVIIETKHFHRLFEMPAFCTISFLLGKENFQVIQTEVFSSKLQKVNDCFFTRSCIKQQSVV
jgi:hypothetical protein